MTETLRPEPSRFYRWLVLIFVSLAMFGSYYAYDALSPLADVLKQQLHFTDLDIGFLQAIYSFPNIFTVLIGGFVIDRIGLRKSLLIFGVLSVVGPAITAATSHLSIMATGRLIFGMGAESLNVAVVTALARWFKGKELSFAFGLNLTASRLGTFAALNSPTWARAAYASWRTPFLIALAFSALSLVGAIVYWLLEDWAEKNYSLGKVSTDKVVFADLWKFGVSYWLIVALCVVFYSAIFPFQTFAVKFFMEAHGTSREFGGFLSSMLTLFAMIATPLFGLWVDRVGKRAQPVCPHGHDGSRVFPDSSGDVAFGRLHCGFCKARNGLRTDDHDPEHRPLRTQPAGRLGQQFQPRRRLKSGRLPPRHVDLLDPWNPGRTLLVPITAA
jgi:MFS family permease